jgi:hypothetical protein
MKKIRGDKPIGVIIHIYMELSQGNSLCSYLYLKLKCPVFCFISSLFSSTKLGLGRQTSPAWGEGWHQCGRGEGHRRLNMVQKMCTHVYKCKNDTC